MFQDGSDGVPTDSPQTLGAVAGRHAGQSRPRTPRALQSSPPADAARATCGPEPNKAGADPPRSGRGPATRRAIPPTPRGWPPSRRPSDLRRTGRGARQNPGKCTRPAPRSNARRRPNEEVENDGRGRGLRNELNTGGRLCGPVRLPLNGFTYS